MTDLSSDILERQFGPTEIEILRQDEQGREIITKVIATGQILERSKVRFRPAGVQAFPAVHKEILTGKSIGKAFREHGVYFARQVHRVHKTRISTRLEVTVMVGPDRLPYADIDETYAPEVDWPAYKVLIIDNYDSFTYNLYQQIASLGHVVEVAKHDQITLQQIEKNDPSHIVISPGPKTPADSGISRDVIKRFYKTMPILGVCLGMQCIGAVFGSQIIPASRIMHGKTDQIFHDRSKLFSGLPDPFTAARYHSLVVDKLPTDFIKTAWSGDGSLMAIQHLRYPLYGVQFHPESFMTPDGESLMRNFLS